MSETPNQPSTSTNSSEFNNPDFQAGLKALLSVYQPILENDLKLAKNPEELAKASGRAVVPICSGTQP